MERNSIATARAPAAIGPYSQAVMAGDMLFTSGQIPLDPNTGALVVGDVRSQTRQVMANLGAILEHAGLGFDDVVQAHVYLVDLDDFGAMNEVYAAYFCAYPARTTIQANRLPRDARVEVALIAVAGRSHGPACARNPK